MSPSLQTIRAKQIAHGQDGGRVETYTTARSTPGETTLPDDPSAEPQRRSCHAHQQSYTQDQQDGVLRVTREDTAQRTEESAARHKLGSPGQPHQAQRQQYRATAARQCLDPVPVPTADAETSCTSQYRLHTHTRTHAAPRKRASARNLSIQLRTRALCSSNGSAAVTSHMCVPPGSRSRCASRSSSHAGDSP